MSIDTGFQLFSHHLNPVEANALASKSHVCDVRKRADWITEIPLTLEYLLTTLEPAAADVLQAACSGLLPLTEISDDVQEFGIVPPSNVPAVAAALAALDVDAFVDRARACDLEELVETADLWDVESWTYDPDFDIGEALPHIVTRLRDTFEAAARQGHAVVIERGYPT